MTTTNDTLTPINEYIAQLRKDLNPPQAIAWLSTRLANLEDKSTPEARKIRKEIRRLKDSAGIDRTRQPKADPKVEEPVETVHDILATYKQMTAKVQAARKAPIHSGLPTPEDSIAHAEEAAGVHHHSNHSASPTCRKCHSYYDSDTRCQSCGTPLCNCGLKDELCKKCRKAQPKLETGTKNLGKFGRHN